MKKNLLFVVVLLFAGSMFAQKLAPNALMLLHTPQATERPMRSIAQEAELVKVFVEITNLDVVDKIKAQGVEILSVISDQLLTAQIPLSSLQAIAELEEVKYVQISSDVRLQMDRARNNARVNLAHLDSVESGTYSGKGVVLGLVDTGMEYGHVAFYSSDRSEFRLKRVWDQNSKMGHAPAAFGYGTEYVTEESILAAQTDNKEQFHATHVAGVAAGADLSSNFYGVAPGVDLVMVSYNPNSGRDVDVVNGVKYIFDYADSVGKPCVVNLSLGSHFGPHDGTSPNDRAFDEMVGPGRIIVGAVGNEAIYNLHVGKTFTSDDNQLKTMIGYEKETGVSSKFAGVDIWGDVNATMKVKGVVVDAMKGTIIAQTKELSSLDNNGEAVELTLSNSTSGVTGDINLSIAVNPYNNRPNAFLKSTVTSIAANRRIGIIVTGNAGDEVHMWSCNYGTFLDAGKTGWTAGDNLYTVGEIGGTGKNTVGVGSYNTRVSYSTIAGNTYKLNYAVGKIMDRSLFSSLGPTLDGRTKPDVLAPGVLVSSVSSYFVNALNIGGDVAQVTNADGTNYYYDMSVGTSMASPFVAGSVALWLQANPNLTPADVKNIIQRTSRTDLYTGSVPNNACGYGKIDTYAGLLIAATPLSLEETEMAMSLLKVNADPRSHTLQFFFADGDGTCGLNVAVYDTMGRYVANYRIDANGQVVDASALKGGLYILQMECNGVVKSEKVVL